MHTEYISWKTCKHLTKAVTWSVLVLRGIYNHQLSEHYSLYIVYINWVASTRENNWTIMIKIFITTKGESAVCYALNYDWIRVDMKYSSVVSCRDGMPLKRHWFDKPNKRWWGLIINGGIDDSVWWPWAPSDWIGLTVNNEWGDSWLISEVVSLPDTQLAFQWGLQHRRQHANKHPDTCRTGRIAASQQD